MASKIKGCSSLEFRVCLSEEPRGLAIQRQGYERVGGFDESFTHLEDAEFCVRVQLTGVELAPSTFR